MEEMSRKQILLKTLLVYSNQIDLDKDFGGEIKSKLVSVELEKVANYLNAWFQNIAEMAQEVGEMSYEGQRPFH